MEPERIMQAIGTLRPVFHSEADFQHAFAWELHRSNPDFDIRLEVPIRKNGETIHLDLLARTQSREVAVELKYKTRKLNVVVAGEDFALTDQAAQDIGRYDFCKDLARIEAFTGSGENRFGYAIFLTNDSAYWKSPASDAHGYVQFAMHEGRTISGELRWGERAALGTRRGRESSILISGSYRLSWLNYSVLPVNAFKEFRYVCVGSSTA